jgi:DNA-binding transcriptional regulator YiaG
MSRRHLKQDKEKMASELKAYRRVRNMTQEELARMLETSVFSVNRWETAKHYPNSTTIKLMKILKILS